MFLIVRPCVLVPFTRHVPFAISRLQRTVDVQALERLNWADSERHAMRLANHLDLFRHWHSRTTDSGEDIVRHSMVWDFSWVTKSSPSQQRLRGERTCVQEQMCALGTSGALIGALPLKDTKSQQPAPVKFLCKFRVDAACSVNVNSGNVCRFKGVNLRPPKCSSTTLAC